MTIGWVKHVTKRAVHRVIVIPIRQASSALPDSTTYGEIEVAGRLTRFKFDKSQYDKIVSIRLRATLLTEDTGEVVYVKLYNNTDTDEVDGSEISRTGVGSNNYINGIITSSDCKADMPNSEKEYYIISRKGWLGVNMYAHSIILLVEQSE